MLQRTVVTREHGRPGVTSILCCTPEKNVWLIQSRAVGRARCAECRDFRVVLRRAWPSMQTRINANAH